MWVLCGSFKEPGQLQSSPEAIVFRHFSRDRLKSFLRPQPLRHDPLIWSLSLFRLKNPSASPDIIPSISFKTSIENPTQTPPDMIPPMPTGRKNPNGQRGRRHGRNLWPVCRTLCINFVFHYNLQHLGGTRRQNKNHYVLWSHSMLGRCRRQLRKYSYCDNIVYHALVFAKCGTRDTVFLRHRLFAT